MDSVAAMLRMLQMTTLFRSRWLLAVILFIAAFCALFSPRFYSLVSSISNMSFAVSPDAVVVRPNEAVTVSEPSLLVPAPRSNTASQASALTFPSSTTVVHKHFSEQCKSTAHGKFCSLYDWRNQSNHNIDCFPFADLEAPRSPAVQGPNQSPLGIPFHMSGHVCQPPLLPQKVLDAALKRVPGDRTGLRQMLSRLKAKGRVNVQLFGGSETLGTLCNSCDKGGCWKQWGKCRWGTRLKNQIQMAFPDADISVNNLGKPAHNTQSFLPLIGVIEAAQASPPDLIIVDFAVNDRRYAWKAYAQKLKGKLQNVDDIKPEMLEGASAQKALKSMAQEHGISLEVLLCQFRALVPQAQILVVVMLESSSDDNAAVQNEYAKVCQHYNVPLVSYADAADALVKLGGLRKQMWLGEIAHPNWWAHTYLADILANLFNIEYSAMLAGAPLTAVKKAVSPLHKRAKIDLYMGCVKPVTIHQSSTPGDISPRGTEDGSWKLYEDRPGKPGWIADGSRGHSVLSFPVQFGSARRLIISYLRSYEGLGKANVSVGTYAGRFSGKGDGKEFMLDGHWDTHSSQVFNEYLCHGSTYNPRGCKAEAGAWININFRIVEGMKFKLTGIITC